MPKQTKPFIVEIKQSRKLKPDTRKPSIWGNLDLKLAPDDRLEEPRRRDAVDRDTVGATRSTLHQTPPDSAV
ncbi:hypothetical protein U8330_20710 [Rhizobium sp. CC-YZS058]|nr:hypothetical protein [Rhizobium sp. CC-YZS058]MEA3537162.1 hypothetical protein [Rhizobium sp. CC-YZS058]